MIIRRRKIFFVRNIVILIILIYSLVTLLKNDFDRYNVEIEFMKFQDRLNDVNHEIQILSDELSLSNTKEYLEVLVREKLGYVIGGEKSVINTIKYN